MHSEAQSVGSALLVRPAAFGFNEEAARSNVFARPSEHPEISSRVLAEFDAVADRLTRAGVDVHVMEDSPDPPKPDAIFPNNWVSFHSDGTVVIYPMAAETRRRERNPEGIRDLLARSSFEVRRIVDLTVHEQHGRSLEGTGSLILDRPRRRAFASISPRTDPAVIRDFDEKLGYSTLVFDAADAAGRPIYHTNVLMSLGTEFAVLCLDALAEDQRRKLLEEIEARERTLVAVDFRQLNHFACNIIELRGSRGESVIALSSTALASFRPDQRRVLERFGELADAPIPTIERVGGGSVRCMIADIHLPRRT